MCSKISFESLKITVENIGKKYGRNWVFRNLDFNVPFNSKLAITGKNGSGKSTLLQILSGYLTPSEGKVVFNDGQSSDLKTIFIAPYTEIIEEFTLHELLNFHRLFRKTTLSNQEMADKASLPLNKYIKDFSTGMKQRVKLILCFFFSNDIIFMDEPTSNLDDEGYLWWREEMEKIQGKCLILASNQENELELFSQKLTL